MTKSLFLSSLRHCIATFAVAATICLPAAAQSFKATNIISDGSVAATITDANFINPWGLSPTGTWWINAQGTGLSYAVATTPTVSFKVTVPSSAAPNTAAGFPSGVVTTGGAVGMVIPNGTKANFLFSTLDGTISGWNSKLGTNGAVAQVVVNNSASGASYTDLALLNIAPSGVTTTSFLLAPNFASGKVEVYDSNFASAKLTGTFTDPTLPSNYAPFSVHVIGTKVYVAYALRGSTGRATVALGDGIVSIFDNAGNFVSRAITGGNLNAPWGVAIAPAKFGIFSNDLLIGNFGDGIINVYDPATFAYLGQLVDGTGKPLAYPSLWELLPGGTTVTGTTAVSGGDTSTVYFTSGLTADEKHGLFGGIANTTTAGSTPTFGFSFVGASASVAAGNFTQVNLSIAPVNGFSGTVTLACSNAPVGVTCATSPASFTVSANAVSTGSLTILTSKAVAEGKTPANRTAKATGITAAMFFPFASFLAWRRRKSTAHRTLQLLSLALLFVATNGLLLGCGGVPMSTTPSGTSSMTVTASSGSTTQTATIALTVQ